MTTRRRFLQHSSLISLSPMLPSLFGTTARAANAAPDERVLVVIQLDGGNDGLNTVVPFGDDGYGRARNELRLDTDKLRKIDDHVGLHPSMRGAKELLDDGRLAIVQGVGYPNPNRSHFRSMKIWQTARFDEADHDSYGWLGRSLDEQQSEQSGGVSDAVFVGETETPVALWSRRSSTMSLTTTEDLELNRSVNPAEPTALAAGLVQSGLGQTDLARFISKQMLTAYDASTQLKSNRTLVKKNQETYPSTQLGSRLKTVSQMLKSGSQSRVYYMLQPGYDTHAAQLFTHARLLREFSDAMKSFQDDLKSSGLDDRVIVLAFSEFGRRVNENGSLGTDQSPSVQLQVVIDGPISLSREHGGELPRRDHCPIIWLPSPSALRGEKGWGRGGTALKTERIPL